MSNESASAKARVGPWWHCTSTPNSTRMRRHISGIHLRTPSVTLLIRAPCKALATRGRHFRCGRAPMVVGARVPTGPRGGRSTVPNALLGSVFSRLRQVTSVNREVPVTDGGCNCDERECNGELGGAIVIPPVLLVPKMPRHLSTRASVRKVHPESDARHVPWCTTAASLASDKYHLRTPFGVPPISPEC